MDSGMKYIIIFLVLYSTLFSSDKLQTINRSVYKYLEYKILKDGAKGLFVQSQPYRQSDALKLLDNSSYKKFMGIVADSSFQIRVSPGFSLYKSDNDDNIYPHLNGEINLAFNDLVLANNGRFDRTVEFDPYFHGDKTEKGMGYFDEAYALYMGKNFEIFGGRVSRNWGALNEFSLIFSNNPYSFDHFGFSAQSKSVKYSYYIARLNDMYGTDLQGAVITDSLPNGDHKADVNRFWSAQRVDYKVNDDLQLGFTQATVYGGPNETFQAGYLSPFNLYYLTQRNQRAQMSFYIDFNLYYRPFKNMGLYLDIFMDDLIINNEEGQDDRAEHPDRLGVMFKCAYNDLIWDRTITSLRYVRIWNESYTTYRDFENYVYFKKGMGFPYNSHESLKLDISGFQFDDLIWSFDLDFWRQGAREVTTLFVDKVNSFPLSPVTYGITPSVEILYGFKGFEADLTSKVILSSLDKGEVITDNHDFEFKLKVKYNFDFSL